MSLWCCGVALCCSVVLYRPGVSLSCMCCLSLCCCGGVLCSCGIVLMWCGGAVLVFCWFECLCVSCCVFNGVHALACLLVCLLGCLCVCLCACVCVCICVGAMVCSSVCLNVCVHFVVLCRCAGVL